MAEIKVDAGGGTSAGSNLTVTSGPKVNQVIQGAALDGAGFSIGAGGSMLGGACEGGDAGGNVLV